MQVEEMVGRRVKEAREALGMTQESLGLQVQQFLGKTWSRQAVSLAESGKRSFTAVELIALTIILELPSTAALLEPSFDDDVIEFPSGEAVGAAAPPVPPQTTAIQYDLEGILSSARDLADVASREMEAHRSLAQAASEIALSLAEGMQTRESTLETIRKTVLSIEKVIAVAGRGLLQQVAIGKEESRTWGWIPSSRKPEERRPQRRRGRVGG